MMANGNLTSPTKRMFHPNVCSCIMSIIRTDGVIEMIKETRVNEEDLKYIKAQMLYPVILDVLERDLEKIKEMESLKFPDLYAMKLKSIMNQYSSDAYEVRKYMRKRGIKILEEKRTVDRLTVDYLFRGYTSNFHMLWTYVKSEVSITLCKYLEIDITDEKLR